MKMKKTKSSFIPLAGVAASLAAAAVGAAPTYLGVGQVSELTLDDSGLTNKLYLYPDDQAKDAPFSFQVLAGNRVGGFGSGIATTGLPGTYFMTADRGPIDGQVSSVVPVKNGPNSTGVTGYVDRFYASRISVVPDSSIATGYRVNVEIGHATPLIDPDNALYYNGLSSAFDNGTRLDPEALRVSNDGKTVWITDEYGPYLMQFNIRTGQRIRQIPFPAKFLIQHPDADAGQEDSNSRDDFRANPLLGGRLSNKGAEGLALSPDGTTAFALMQNPITQDGGTDYTFTRLVRFDLQSGQTQEFVYRLDNKKNGTHEMLAIDDHRFLVIETNGKGMEGAKAGGVKNYTDPGTQKLFLIDLAGATDVSNIASLQGNNLPAGVQPVSKKLFLDLLDAVPHDPFDEFNARNPDAPWLEEFIPAANGPGQDQWVSLIPSKIEGLAWGEDIVDSQGKLQHVLLVTTDNDLVTDGTPNGTEPFQEGGTDGVTGQVYPQVPQHGIPSYVMAFGVSETDLPGLVKQQLANIPADFNADGVVDAIDLALLNAQLNKPLTSGNSLYDLNKDGLINAADARRLVTLCSKPRCQ